MRSDVRASGAVGSNRHISMLRFLILLPLPTATNHFSLTIARLEAGKRRDYQERILNVEHSSFLSLIFSTSVVQSDPTASTVYKRLVFLLKK